MVASGTDTALRNVSGAFSSQNSLIVSWGGSCLSTKTICLGIGLILLVSLYVNPMLAFDKQTIRRKRNCTPIKIQSAITLPRWIFLNYLDADVHCSLLSTCAINAQAKIDCPVVYGDFTVTIEALAPDTFSFFVMHWHSFPYLHQVTYVI